MTPDYESALRSDASNAQIARDFGKSKDAVRRARKKLGLRSPNSPVGASATGESETHNPDGSSSYVRFSQEPWGYEDYREFIRSKGQDPDQVTFTWGWTSNPLGGFWNKLNNVRPVAGTTPDTVPLTELYKRAEAVAKEGFLGADPETGTGRALVVALADWQLGKTARRGGTADTLARLKATRDRLREIYAEGRYERILLFDLGDGIEGFESGGNPMFTNDLSLPDQLDCYSTELFMFTEQAACYAPSTLASVPSNHAAWRRGKQNLGKPADDFGLFVNKQVQKAAKIAGMDTRFVRPDDYDESVSVSLLGTEIGGVHGNQFAPGKAIDWWQGQAFGSQAITKSDVLLTGHYHSFGAGVAGINPNSGRERYWLGAPTVDPGSDWYRNIKGRDSLPGTLIFEVDGNGFDLGSMRII